MLYLKEFRLIIGGLMYGLLVLFIPPDAMAQSDRIEEIRFVGNNQTKEQIMRQEMIIKEGDPADPDKIEASRQAIMDLGLFKEVHTRLLPGEQGQILEIKVDEKFYVIPMPHLDRNADGEVRYGADLTVDNLAGLNQRLKLNYEAKRGCCETAGRLTHTIDLSYSYPRIVGSHFGLDMALVRKIHPVSTIDSLGKTIAEHENIYSSFGLGLSRWLSHEGPSQGWIVGAALFWRFQELQQKSGAPLDYPSEKAAGVEFNFSYTRVHDYLYSREGVEFGYISEVGLDAFDSDNTFGRNQVYYRRYVLLGLPHEHTNLNFQLRLGGSGSDIPLRDNAYSLGSSDDLRGYEKNSIVGKSYSVMNIEYLHPLFGYAPTRGVIFADIGNAYADNRVLALGDLESSIGLGFRYRIKALVNFQLRVDVTYAFGTEKKKVYFGSKNTF
jgi:outer membrane protein assembly factor BamA